MENRFCYNEECDYYPYEKKLIENSKEEEKDLQDDDSIYTFGGLILDNTIYTTSDVISNTDPKLLIEECDNVSVNLKCLFCSHLKKIDMHEMKKILNARNLLSK